MDESDHPEWEDREETCLVAVPLRTAQLLIREVVNVQVGPTQVAVARPAHPTLRGGHTVKEVERQSFGNVIKQLKKKNIGCEENL